jgi:hypothetical protein
VDESGVLELRWVCTINQKWPLCLGRFVRYQPVRLTSMRRNRCQPSAVSRWRDPKTAPSRCLRNTALYGDGVKPTSWRTTPCSPSPTTYLVRQTCCFPQHPEADASGLGSCPVQSLRVLAPWKPRLPFVSGWILSTPVSAGPRPTDQVGLQTNLVLLWIA